jgi:hypothetical protein
VKDCSNNKSNRSGIIEGRRAEGVHPENLPFDSTGKTFLSDLGNSPIQGKNSDYWSRTIAKLTNLGDPVVVPDQIAFGKSAKLDIRYQNGSAMGKTVAMI